MIKLNELVEESIAMKGDLVCVAADLLDNFVAEVGVTAHDVIAEIDGAKCAGTICAHPLADDGYDHDVPMFAGDFVTTEQGTGFVHTAPGHGVEDYELAHLEHGIPVPDTVAEDGKIMPHLPLFAGMHVLRDNQKIADMMAERGGVIAIGKQTHSYPHSVSYTHLTLPTKRIV